MLGHLYGMGSSRLAHQELAVVAGFGNWWRVHAINFKGSALTVNGEKFHSDE